MAVPPAIKQKVVEAEYRRRNLVPVEVERQASWECAACDFPMSSGGAGLNRTAGSVMRHAEQRSVLLII